MSSKTNTASVVHVPVVEQVLLGSRAPSRVQSDVVVLVFGGGGERVSSGLLKFVNAGGAAVDPFGVEGRESVAHFAEFRCNLVC